MSRRTDAERRIAEAALDAFAKNGYNATTTSEIARQAGVAEGTIFRYYPTKQELLTRVVAPVAATLLAPVVRRNLEAILTAPHPTPESLMRSILADRLDLVRDHPAVFRVLAQELPIHPELRAQFRRAIFDHLFPLALAAIRRFQQSGQLNADLAPTTVARIILSTFAGYIMARTLLAPDAEWDDDREIDTMIHVLTKGLS